MVHADIVFISDGVRVKKHLRVDDGSMLTWIHGATLRKLGIKPAGTRTFETIEGRHVRRPIGEVQIEYGGQRVHTIVVFADAKEGEVLGLCALEGLSVEIDPGRKRLKQTKVLKAY